MLLALKPKDYIINMANENGGKVISSFLLHGLKILNNEKCNITIKSISFNLYAKNALVKQIMYQAEALYNKINAFTEDTDWLGFEFSEKLYLGEEKFWSIEACTNSLELKPNQETGVFNEYFIVVDDKFIDRLEIKVKYSLSNNECEESIQIPLIKYTNKNKYIFPLRGSISTCGNYNTLPEHRQHYSMEFAFDMAQYNQEQKLCYKENMNDEDYTIYGKDILAVADGEVIDCYNSFNMTSSWIWSERKPYIIKYGLAAQCGNYIVIKHDNEEYSFYGHLQLDSLTVKKGDIVYQGQTIGKVGSTGLSGCPHLHFQLMDGPSFLENRGLPCSFTNITDVCGNKLDFIQEENIIVHAE